MPPPQAGADNARQLALIDELSQIAESFQIPYWLRGGWAMDFFLGRITRPHEDVDLFAWAADSARLVEALEAHGFAEIEGPPRERQRNLARDGASFTSRCSSATPRVRSARRPLLRIGARGHQGCSGRLEGASGRFRAGHQPGVATRDQAEVPRMAPGSAGAQEGSS